MVGYSEREGGGGGNLDDTMVSLPFLFDFWSSKGNVSPRIIVSIVFGQRMVEPGGLMSTRACVCRYMGVGS